MAYFCSYFSLLISTFTRLYGKTNLDNDLNSTLCNKQAIYCLFHSLITPEMYKHFSLFSVALLIVAWHCLFPNKAKQ